MLEIFNGHPQVHNAGGGGSPGLEQIWDQLLTAGAPHHEVVAERTFRRGGTITALLPHMHLRGKAFRYELIRADGTEEVLLDVPRYDFNWQLVYEPKVDIRIEPGMTLRGRAWYDNSAGNPANPDPTMPVKFGEQSFEEMMFGFFDWIPDPAPPRPAQGRRTAAATN